MFQCLSYLKNSVLLKSVEYVKSLGLLFVLATEHTFSPVFKYLATNVVSGRPA